LDAVAKGCWRADFLLGMDMYDFVRCKLCGALTGSPAYELETATIYVCSACDFHYIDHLDTLPKEDPEITRHLLDQRAWDFIESMLGPNGRQLQRNLALVKQFCQLKGLKCLDIGSGAGVFPHLVKQEGGIPFGIEPQQVFREFAAKKFDLTLYEETVDEPFWQQQHAASFDVVTLWDTLEHVNFPAETLEYAGKLGKPGGLLFLDTPSRDAFVYKASEWSYRLSQGAKSFMLNSLYSPKPFRHKQIFTLKQLTDLVERVGYEVKQTNYSRISLSNKIRLVAQKKA